MWNNSDIKTLDKFGFKQELNIFYIEIENIRFTINQDGEFYILKQYDILYDDQGRYYVDLSTQSPKPNQSLEDFIIENI